MDGLYEFKSADRYDRARALFPEDLVAWLQETQPEAWDVLDKSTRRRCHHSAG